MSCVTLHSSHVSRTLVKLCQQSGFFVVTVKTLFVTIAMAVHDESLTQCVSWQPNSHITHTKNPKQFRFDQSILNTWMPQCEMTFDGHVGVFQCVNVTQKQKPNFSLCSSWTDSFSSHVGTSCAFLVEQTQLGCCPTMM